MKIKLNKIVPKIEEVNEWIYKTTTVPTWVSDGAKCEFCKFGIDTDYCVAALLNHKIAYFHQQCYQENISE